MTRVLIGCGAGFAGDRFDAAVPVVRELAAADGPRFLMFETLAERTLALARAGIAEGRPGHSPYIDRYLAPILREALESGVRIVSNMGAADPVAGARRVQALARELGLTPPRVAVVHGDDLRDAASDDEIRAMPAMDGADVLHRPILAANTYLGARPVADALATGAPVVLVGRTVDSALALGPLIDAFGWGAEDLDLMAAGTVVGHLLECGAQVSGAYFADPGFKDVPDLAHVGFPIAQVTADGAAEIFKPAGTGGRVDRATVIEQLLYEMHDPAAYLVPDATVDVTALELAEVGPDRVRVTGARGRPGPERLKATVCVDDGWMAEAEMSYAGPNALARARLAGEVVSTRLREMNLPAPALDLIGVGASHDRGDMARSLARGPDPDGDHRIRAALAHDDRAAAQTLCDEMLSLYCSGPAGGGGYRGDVTRRIATASVMVDRALVEPRVRVEVIAP